VERATDAIAFGEWAAPQRQSSGDSPPQLVPVPEESGNSPRLMFESRGQ
jgi:hypothetical protein